MKNELQIQLIETDIIWENPQKNRDILSNRFTSLTLHADIIILPEMFTTGFTMNTALAETMQGETILWMQQQAKQLNSAIVGSLLITENDHFMNRAIFMKPTGDFEYYDKHNLFVLSEEYKIFTSGITQPIIEWQGWHIALFICFDLRFPIWSWNIIDKNNHKYDLAIYMGNWPTIRQYHWNSLLIARAIENRCYVIGVNRIGTDENKIKYNGGSTIIDFCGNQITTPISLCELKNFRTNIFPMA